VPVSNISDPPAFLGRKKCRFENGVYSPEGPPKLLSMICPMILPWERIVKRLTVGPGFLVGEDERSFPIDMCSRIFYSEKISVWGI
jgi:hypothetical protein